MEASGEFPKGTKQRLIGHWANVNGASAADFETHRKTAFDRFSRLSEVPEWQWDWGPVSDWIAEEFGDDDPFEGWPKIY